MPNAACLECKSTPLTMPVGGKHFVVCQDDSHRRRADNGVLTEYGLVLSDGHDSPAAAEADWAASRQRRMELN